MAKATAEKLLEEIADDFHTYLRKGVRFDRVIGSAHTNLNIDDIETLLRIHFVLTDAEGDADDVGVVDFMRGLEAHIRQMKTTTSPESYELHGEVRGKVNWAGTVKRRARAGRLNEPIFICDRPEVHYDVNENLVLKRLLSIVHDIVMEDLAYARDNPDGYEWLDAWVQSEVNSGEQKHETTAEMLDRIYQQNVYLQQIDVDETEITNRTIESVKRSRSKFYQEAAVLLDRYRQLMNHELDSPEARTILNHTLIAPEKTEVLFELYWVFRVLDAYEGVEYRVLADSRADATTIATWTHEDSRYVLSHNATGGGLTFGESVDAADIEPDGHLYRMNEVISRWKTLSSVMLGRGGSNSLWGGRPDIVLERYHELPKGGWELAQVFIGEVKYTQNIDYVATGLRELLEYMAYVKSKSTNEYVEGAENVLDSVNVEGALFIDRLNRETMSPPGEGIKIVQYPESPDQVL